MRAFLSQYLNFYKTSAKQRYFLLGQIEETARAQNADDLADLLALVSEARAHDQETLKLEASWRGQSDRDNQHGPRARELDDELDRALAGLHGHLQAQSGLYPEAHPRREAAFFLEERLFPEGLSAVVHLPYIEQHSEVRRMLDDAESPEAADAVSLLGLGEPLARLTELCAEYGAELNQGEEKVKLDDLRAARSFGEELMAEVIVAILAARKPGERGLGRRRALLEPIERQNDHLRSYHKARVRRGDSAPSGDGDAAEMPEAA